MKTVYMCFSTDILHSGHINIIEQAAKLGAITAGVLCDECVEIYEKYPILPIEERKRILQNIKGIHRVVVQNDIYYDEILEELKPDYVVHGDNWKTGYQAPIREAVIQTLKKWGGQLVEYPYYEKNSLEVLNSSLKDKLGFPETRRQRLKYQLQSGELINAIEVHDGLSALIAEYTSADTDEGIKSFDAMWVSSLCDSTVKGKPDIELVDLTSRLQTVDEILEVTTKPIIFDGDTGGQIEHFTYNVRTLERVGYLLSLLKTKKG